MLLSDSQAYAQYLISYFQFIMRIAIWQTK